MACNVDQAAVTVATKSGILDEVTSMDVGVEAGINSDDFTLIDQDVASAHDIHKRAYPLVDLHCKQPPRDLVENFRTRLVEAMLGEKVRRGATSATQ
ncbi:hypothetical protein SUNI508_11720 [Seiridium unicorne]|uniref:Uncharacterized protein n=1 Tax=Seiridium unicorne TaxID=138068 RepID=A0ABR2UGW2_9PEZI